MSRAFRFVAAGSAAAALAFTGVSLAVITPANADEEECLQVLENEDVADPEAACEAAAEGDLAECLTQILGDKPDSALIEVAAEACAAAYEPADDDGDTTTSTTTTSG